MSSVLIAFFNFISQCVGKRFERNHNSVIGFIRRFIKHLKIVFAVNAGVDYTRSFAEPNHRIFIFDFGISPQFVSRHICCGDMVAQAVNRHHNGSVYSGNLFIARNGHIVNHHFIRIFRENHSADKSFACIVFGHNGVVIAHYIRALICIRNHRNGCCYYCCC